MSDVANVLAERSVRGSAHQARRNTALIKKGADPDLRKLGAMAAFWLSLLMLFSIILSKPA